MAYQAERRLEITLEDASAAAERTHEDRGDGTPVCNIRRGRCGGERLVTRRWDRAKSPAAFAPACAG
jgi:hypothetical protein